MLKDLSFFIRENSLTQWRILSISAIEKVQQYYRDIDAGNLNKAVLNYFGKSALYQRNHQTFQGLNHSPNSIRTFYTNGRGLSGEHTVLDLYIPQTQTIAHLNNTLIAQALPPIRPLKRHQIPVLVHGQYTGIQTLKGQSTPVNVAFKDLHVVAPAQNNTVAYRYSLIYSTNQPTNLARV